MNPAIQILAQWAWAKVDLENARREGRSVEKITAAQKEFRRALRVKKKLDEEYADHHEALALADDKQAQLL